MGIFAIVTPFQFELRGWLAPHDDHVGVSLVLITGYIGVPS